MDLYRGINKYKRDYEPRSSLVKNEKGELLADSHNILNRWENYSSQLLNVYNVSDVRKIEIHTAELLLSGSCSLEVEIAIATFRKFKSSGLGLFPAVLIHAGSEDHELISCIWSKEELPDEWKELIIVPVHKKGDKTN
jgi:hypothetical protein